MLCSKWSARSDTDGFASRTVRGPQIPASARVTTALAGVRLQLGRGSRCVRACHAVRDVRRRSLLDCRMHRWRRVVSSDQCSRKQIVHACPLGQRIDVDLAPGASHGNDKQRPDSNKYAKRISNGTLIIDEFICSSFFYASKISMSIHWLTIGKGRLLV